MGILSRFKNIMESNINALLDKAEDPEKMIDESLRDMNDDLNKVKSETATVMAEQMRCKREYDENIAEVEKMQSYAERAVLAGNDGDAKNFLSKKAMLVAQQTNLKQAAEFATTNATMMRAMHDKLIEQISELKARRNSIQAKIKVAKTQERIIQFGSSVNNSQGSISTFEAMEEKANNMLDKANAMAELNAGKTNESAYNDKIDQLEDKYDATPEVSVDAELAALKSKLKK